MIYLKCKFNQCNTRYFFKRSYLYCYAKLCQKSAHESEF